MRKSEAKAESQKQFNSQGDRALGLLERFVQVQERRLERDRDNDRLIVVGVERLAQLLLEKLFEPRNK